MGALRGAGNGSEKEETEKKERHEKGKEGENKHPEVNSSLRSCDETDNSHMMRFLSTEIVGVGCVVFEIFLILHEKYYMSLYRPM